MNKSARKNLPVLIKLIYGSGDWGKASYNVLRQFFYAIFLTDVVRLDPRLASVAALIAIIWDAINDPLIGSISDRVSTRWGRRRPFLLFFSLPFGLAFLLLWWAPPWTNQWLLMLHVTVAYLISDTLQTLVTVPYLSLTSDLAPDYDQRTSLTSYRMFFNLFASLITAASAPSILEAVMKSGMTSQQGYMIIAAIFGSLAFIPYLVLFFVVREREPVSTDAHNSSLSFKNSMRVLRDNKPFRSAAILYVFNWIAFDVLALMLPYFILYWIEGGNLFSQVSLFGVKVALESVVVGVALLSGTIMIPLANWLSKRFDKTTAYLIGIMIWALLQIVIFLVQPGQVVFGISVCAALGFSIAVAHVVPESLFPDVIDWDEYTTGQQREGIYFGAFFFIRKLGSALAVFISLQLLGWFGYQAPPPGVETFTQNPGTIMVIRLLAGPFIILPLLGAGIAARRYPLDRKKILEIQDSI